jgi:predicted 3-demethylubiquinone-9 3-methyltransferase (glyoxalase superfamily)
MQKITTFLWFDNQAEDAANLYTSLFNDAKILGITRYTAAGPAAEGTVMTVEFQLEGQRFIALNGGPQYQFTEAISLLVDCADQAEVDELWEQLTADGGEEGPCGWCKDKYGVSWQIVPSGLLDYVSDPDPEKARRATEAMFSMTKIDIARVKEAYESAT